MLIDMKWKPSYLKLDTHESRKAMVIYSLSGNYITTLSTDMPYLKQYLERMDRLQGKRMKKYGQCI